MTLQPDLLERVAEIGVRLPDWQIEQAEQPVNPDIAKADQALAALAMGTPHEAAQARATLDSMKPVAPPKWRFIECWKFDRAAENTIVVDLPI